MKVWNFMAIMLGMIIFLSIMGFDLSVNNTDNSSLLTDIGININQTDAGQSTIDVNNSNWYNRLFHSTTGWLVILAATTSIIIGLFGKTQDLKIIIGIPFLTAFGVKFLSIGWAMVNLARGEDWLVMIIVTIFGTLTGMFVFSMVEWITGSDS